MASRFESELSGAQRFSSLALEYIPWTPSDASCYIIHRDAHKHNVT